VEVPRASQIHVENERLIGRLKDYPDREEEILSTWATRANLWSGVNKNGGGRALKCTAHSTHPMKSIDVYSYEENI
jgi:hypothetical protein